MRHSGPEVIIENRRRAGELLMSRRRGREIQHVLSIGDPESHPPAGFRSRRSRLRLLFHDVTREAPGYEPPRPEDVERIAAFARGLHTASGTLLIHCEAGVSRSTAAALIVLAVWEPDATDDALVRAVRELRPQARPNRRMLDFADAQLERELRAAVKASGRPQRGKKRWRK